MKTKLFMLFSIVICVLMVAGCGDLFSEMASGSDSEESAEEQDTNGATNGATNETTEEQDTNEATNETTEEQDTDKEKSASTPGDFNVSLSGEVIEQDNTFVVEGNSNLLPGARVIGQVWVGENKDDLFADTTELIEEDGSFYMELEHHQYGEAEIDIRFHFDMVQDDKIQRHYGERGQNLEGPFVYKYEHGGDMYKVVLVRVEYTPGGESAALQFEAPDWYDLPEDYGDPRVWIEVDEITEDGEYFYLHGRSNLLEGSHIEGTYNWPNSDETLIKPDGSFDLKIEYEYREDTNFIIEFHPSHYSQWNEIEEAYGENGQNLVGDLVQTSSNGNKQYIEKEIEWNSSN